MSVDIRPFHPSDLPALYRICLLTGDSGKDATLLYPDPELLGHFYAGPYGVLEPESCLIATLDGAPAGYIIGTADSVRFSQRCETEWFPALRRRYPLPPPEDTRPAAGIGRLIHAGYHPIAGTEAYPAHLHIDLLPSLQGKGVGRRIMDAFLDLLRSRGVPGVHLGVGAANTSAVAYYEKVGFHRLQTHVGWYVYARKLT